MDAFLAFLWSHTLRGCVDWNHVVTAFLKKSNRSHPAWVCGLKLEYLLFSNTHFRSHPAWVCGLKRIIIMCLINWYCVTPCVGVWIETFPTENGVMLDVSHPAWVCGLKRKDWMRKTPGVAVTPCVGVWIETLKHSDCTICESHTLRGCVDWNNYQFMNSEQRDGHTLRGCVDWNIPAITIIWK